MNDKRAFLKDLATAHADGWGSDAVLETITGETRAETRNTVYQFRDGTCCAVTRRGPEGKTNPAALVGMRLVGWLSPSSPKPGLARSWSPGAYAVLWRPRGEGEAASAVALTSATHTFAKSEEASTKEPERRPTVRRVPASVPRPAPASPASRQSKPPPPRPSTPRVAPPPPGSATRINVPVRPSPPRRAEPSSQSGSHASVS